MINVLLQAQSAGPGRLIFSIVLICILVILFRYFVRKFNIPLIKLVKTPSSWFVLGGGILLYTLFFHTVFYDEEIMVFPKDRPSFHHTFINQEDIQELINRHNSANYHSRNLIRQESLHQRLVEEGIIIKKK